MGAVTGMRSGVEPMRSAGAGVAEPPIGGALLTVEQMADCLQISPRSIHRLVLAGRIPVIRLGRSVRFDPEAVAAAITPRGASS